MLTGAGHAVSPQRPARKIVEAMHGVGSPPGTVYYRNMTETAADSAHVNGTAPTAEAPCDDCAPTSGERGLAIVAFILGAFVIAVSIDMFTGGKLSGMIPVRVPGE